MLRDVQTLLEPECAAHLSAMVTFTDVEISMDLRYATIYYSVLGDEKAKEKADFFLNGMQRRVKSELGKLLQIKHAPDVRFRFDPSIERGMRIEQILNELAKENDDRKKRDI